MIMTHKDMFQNNFQNELLRNEIRRKMYNWAMASEEFGYNSLTKEECLVATNRALMKAKKKLYPTVDSLASETFQEEVDILYGGLRGEEE